MNLPNQERCCEQGHGWVKHHMDCPFKGPDVTVCPNAAPQNHSTMEGWEEEFDGAFESCDEDECQYLCDPMAQEKVKRFIRTLLAKERESAERRLRKMINELPREKELANRSFKEGWNACRQEILKSLEAARKDTDV